MVGCSLQVEFGFKIGAKLVHKNYRKTTTISEACSCAERKSNEPLNDRISTLGLVGHSPIS